MEAISAEVATLRKHFPASVAWGLSHRRWALVAPRRGVYCLNPKLHLLFRGATRLLEPIFDLNHVFGSLGDWFYLQGMKRRPTVVTAAAHEQPVALDLLERVDRFVVEFESARERLLHEGIHPDRIRMVFPPVDLTRFLPTNPPDGPFTVLFASSPERANWFEARGIPLLLDAAALRPGMRFRLLWRPWGDSLPAIRGMLRERGLRNVEVRVGQFKDMSLQYRQAHATVAPFLRLEQCKPMPNSLVESLACGRPVLLTPEVGLAGMIRGSSGGVVVPPAGVAIAEGLDRLQADWQAHSLAAREFAERWFSLEQFLKGYQRTYSEVLSGRSKSRVNVAPPVRSDSVRPVAR
jgi:glycosyltransferase involved in cell wall biosynthesis